MIRPWRRTWAPGAGRRSSESLRGPPSLSVISTCTRGWRPAANLVAVTERVNILGVGVSAVNMAQALAVIDGWVEHREKQYVCVCPVHSIMECRRAEEVRRIFNAAGMVTPDGMPVVWVARWSGHPNVSRVYGPDLMLAELERVKHRHFFYGGGPGVAQKISDALRKRVPNLDVAGPVCAPLPPLPQLCHAQ